MIVSRLAVGLNAMNDKDRNNYFLRTLVLNAAFSAAQVWLLTLNLLAGFVGIDPILMPSVLAPPFAFRSSIKRLAKLKIRTNLFVIFWQNSLHKSSGSAPGTRKSFTLKFFLKR